MSPTRWPSLADRTAEQGQGRGARARRRAPAATAARRAARASGRSRPTEKIIVIGASTGGVEALKAVLMGLPADCPPILITQHMPPRFTTAFAERLNRECPMTVSEAMHDEIDRARPCLYRARLASPRARPQRQPLSRAACMMGRRCPAIGRRSTCCFARRRASPERSRSA